MAQFDTGDTIFVSTIGEFWLVAYAQDGYVTCCGWPESQIKEEHCELKRKASPEHRLTLLHDLARLNDSRGEYARRELAKPTEAPE